MSFAFSRILAVAICLFGLLILALHTPPVAASSAGTIPPNAPVLKNSDFECTAGYYSTTNAAGKIIYVPNDWHLIISLGAPKTQSARVNFAGSCDGSAHVERIHGIDSILVEARDLEKPPEPGKPFDVTFYQQVSATIGGAYSLSGWMLSLCGGSTVPTDCPTENYIAKMIGIDPLGGTDPLTTSVVWSENRHNFIENNKKVGWTNIRTSAVAQAMTITIFARMSSPFQWHGNHGFIDALGLVRAPTSWLTLPAVVTGTQVITVAWQGEQSPDVLNIPGGAYRLFFDLQYRQQGTLTWQDFIKDAKGAGSQPFTSRCANATYEFRVRARAEQPDGQGVQPNERYPGLWSEPQAVIFQTVPITAPGLGGPNLVYLPVIQDNPVC
jgi:hypothetical protein